MAKSVLNAKHFQDEAAAFAYVEAALWPAGPVCPFCGEAKRVGRLNGATTRPGLCKCYACKKPFTVRIGTIFESSHLALHLWLQIIHLMCASKKGISTRQIQRMLSCSMKTAWHLTHRIREAMGPAAAGGPIGGEGKIVEADELYIGKRDGTVGHGPTEKRTVLALVERGGKVLSFHIDKASKKNVMPLVREHVARESRFMTDKAPHYQAGYGVEHQSVDHTKGEYVRGDVTTNTIEGVFSIFRRGMVGTYQHCGEQHLQRYLNEFDFRYNNRERLGVNDVSRAVIAVKASKGKRLTYRTTGGQ